MKRFFPYDVFERLASLNSKMAKKEKKIQPTSRASSTDWTSRTVSVNSDISGDAGVLAALPNEGGREGLSWSKTDVK